MAKTLDKILLSVLLFALCYAWVVFLTKSKLLSLALAVVLSASVCVYSFRLSEKREKKEERKQNRKKQTDNLEQYLLYAKSPVNVFGEMLCYYGYTVENSFDDYAVCEKDGKVLVATRYTLCAVTTEDVRKLVVQAKKCDCKRLIIFTNQTVPCQNEMPCDVYDKATTYALFEQSGKLPVVPTSKMPTKTAIVPQVAFNKKRFKTYALSSLYLTATSFLTFWPVYTLAWASLLLVLALYSLLNKRFNGKAPSLTL